MKFLVDAQLPPALAHFLKSKGHEAAHVVDFDLEAADDTAVWKFALRSSFVIITKDEDFRDRALLSKNSARVVLIRLGNCSNRALIEWLGPVLPGIVERLDAGERLIEVA